MYYFKRTTGERAGLSAEGSLPHLFGAGYRLSSHGARIAWHDGALSRWIGSLCLLGEGTQSLKNFIGR